MASDSLETTANTPTPTPAGRVFWGPQGLRAGWSILLFLLLVWFSSIVLTTIVGRVQVRGAFYLAYSELLPLIATLAATAVMAVLIERRPLAFYGFARPGMLRRFAAGAFTGFASLSVFLLALGISGHFSPGNVTLHGRGQIAGYAALWAFSFLLVGLLEEILFRGYPLATLARGMGFWPAALLLSAIFGAGHIRTSTENWFGALSAGLFGLLLSFAIRRTGSLWWAIGFHTMWDYSQSFLYATADSGQLFPGHLLNSHFSGPAWITGGDVGPEGSYLILPLLAGVAAVIHFLYPAKKVSEGGNSTTSEHRIAEQPTPSLNQGC